MVRYAGSLAAVFCLVCVTVLAMPDGLTALDPSGSDGPNLQLDDDSLTLPQTVVSLDLRTNRLLTKTRPLGELTRLGNFLGDVEGHVLLGALLYGADDTPRNHNLRGNIVKGLSLNCALTSTIKRVVGRRRPNDEARSWPSGHVSSVVTALTILDSHWKEEGHDYTTPLAAVGALVALSRVQCDRHWLSDTAAGAILGYTCGRAAVDEADGTDLAVCTGSLLVLGLLLKDADGGTLEQSEGPTLAPIPAGSTDTTQVSGPSLILFRHKF